MRCSGVRLSDTELPPSVPHPNVKAIGKPVEIPVPPWLPPVLIRIREAGLLENLKITCMKTHCMSDTILQQSDA